MNSTGCFIKNELKHATIIDLSMFSSDQLDNNLYTALNIEESDLVNNEHKVESSIIHVPTTYKNTSCAETLYYEQQDPLIFYGSDGVIVAESQDVFYMPRDDTPHLNTWYDEEGEMQDLASVCGEVCCWGRGAFIPTIILALLAMTHPWICSFVGQFMSKLLQ